jgi:hypothetical protein
MRKLIMLASVAALTAALPSVAMAKKPPHAGGRSAHAERSAEGPRAPNRTRPRATRIATATALPTGLSGGLWIGTGMGSMIGPRTNTAAPTVLQV